MWVAIHASPWSCSNTGAGCAALKGALGQVPWVRLNAAQNSASDIVAWRDAGYQVDLHVPGNSFSPSGGQAYTNGVCAINPDAWASNAVSYYRSYGPFAVFEVLQEPAGTWYWGSSASSSSNAACYDRLLKQVHDAFVAAFGSSRPPLLASYDGGYSTSDTWGQEMWAADPNVGSYIDGITFHAYGGHISTSALGARANIQDGYNRTHLPVYVTEVGWPTAVGQPATGDSYQWTEQQQAQNIYNFVNWARSVGYISGVVVFKNVDFGSNNWYGVQRLDLSRKPSYYALHEAALGQPLSCTGC
jgi:hypothetical protein